jgi:DMSO/TMAO reductase YedYZ molybdopterin-dependent catalytic subunit
MKKKLLQACLFLTLCGLLLIIPVGKVSADSVLNLQITDLAGSTTSFTYDQLLAMPLSDVSAPLYCYGILRTNGDWQGVSLSYLLQQVGVDSSVASLDFLASDGYKVNIPMQLAIQPDVIIAYERDGLMLSEGLRLVLPEENGNMWIAAITSISMSTIPMDLSQTTYAVPPQLSGILSSANLTGQSQSPSPSPSPIATPTDVATPEPTAPPANATQHITKTIIPQTSSFWSLNSGFALLAFGVGSGAIIALAATGYLKYKRNNKSQQ